MENSISNPANWSRDQFLSAEAEYERLTTCSVCKKRMPINAGKNADKMGVIICCSQYCFEYQNGTSNNGIC